ncbi:MAG: hypothetical protein H6811_00955 [Phycisphaeraceae bacterium]|nr:hypothetical protein [Phycisphaeraceae bacterium]
MSRAGRAIGIGFLASGIAGCACHRSAEWACEVGSPVASEVSEVPADSPDTSAAPNAPPPPESVIADSPLDLRPVFPHVRADLGARVVEFDGIVPMDCHNPATPDVWLEQLVCLFDSKEHESLVMSLATASEIHAALLLIGLEPGSPGHWRLAGQEVVRVPAQGPALRVEVITAGPDGRETLAPLTSWAIHADSGESLDAYMRARDGRFIFGGSRMVVRQGREMYDADGTGTVIGLATFGMETISFSEVISPEEAIDEPEWLADGAIVPAFKTPVRVRLTAMP